MLNKILLYFHTLRYLKLTQFKYRIYYFIRNKFRSKTSFSYEIKTLPTSFPSLKLETSLPATRSIQYHNNIFSFLNLQKKFESDINWNDDIHGKLWTYNLNYFEFLHTPTMTKEKGKALVLDFVNNIESSKDGLEPYPTSLRAIHWIKFLTYHNVQNKEIDASLYQQLWILVDKREYHILGNHLLENGFGLLFGAYYFEDKKLYELAKKILIPELEEQILGDGAHFELSPMYHQLMLYRVLDCYNLVKNNPHFEQELAAFFKEKAEKMLGWLENMTFQNGDIPLLNDSAFFINPTTEEILNYANQLNLKSKKIPLKESGYRKITRKSYELIADIGHIGPDYLPGHAHSDTFNFVLNVNNEPFIVDTGISTYNPTQRRQLERSTASHNTVQIGNYEQSEVWSSFRVARRAYPVLEKDTSNKIAAKLQLSTLEATHHRHFEFRENEVTISDGIKAKKEGKAYLHFHPLVKVEVKGNQIQTNLGLVSIEGAKNIEIVDYQYAPEFNKLITAKKAIISFSTSLETIISI